MSDTWNEIQEVKSKRSSLREKLLKRRKENEGLVADLTGSSSTSSVTTSEKDVKVSEVADAKMDDTPVRSPASVKEDKPPDSPQVIESPSSPISPQSPEKNPAPSETVIEKHLLELLADDTLEMPLEVPIIVGLLCKTLKFDLDKSLVEGLLSKLSAQKLICTSSKTSKDQCAELIVESTDHTKISAMLDMETGRKRKKTTASGNKAETESAAKKSRKDSSTSGGDSVEMLLSMQSSRERETKKASDDIQALLSATTAKEKSLVEKFRSVGGPQVMEFCQHGTKGDCQKTVDAYTCRKLHFRKIINKHTDESLGDCSFLNTCFHMDTCKYVHYEIEKRELPLTVAKPIQPAPSHSQTTLFPNQWIQCDLREFDMSVVGKCAVVMADPPWDIHMELPYGTMGDDEMRALDVPALQQDGYFFLWVTGRAMELGRECLKIWGYDRIDELIWVKTNQLQRIIRTGRTGHWLNHGKEHCLIGVKGNPRGFNRTLDADVIVAEVRATSHKPDEVYGIIERLAPGMRKVELFGRPHNVQPNWITLGNQLDGVKLLDPEIVRRFKERYPSGTCLPQKH